MADPQPGTRQGDGLQTDDLQSALRGVTPPLVTPFEGDAVDHDALAAVVEHVRGAVDALFACGTTGEFASLTATEQRAVIETAVEESGDLPVLAGVSATAVDDAVEHAVNAAEVGADAAVLTPPFFHTSNAPAGNRRFVTDVAERSPLPLFLYNVPQHVGTEFDVESVAWLAGRDDVLGVKDSSGDLAYTLALARESPDDFLVLQGHDRILLPSLRMGLDGGVNALANVLPEGFATVAAEPESDRARRASDAVAALFDVCLDVGLATASKTGLVERGVLERDDVRPPLQPPDEEQRDEIGDAVEAALDAI